LLPADPLAGLSADEPSRPVNWLTSLSRRPEAFLDYEVTPVSPEGNDLMKNVSKIF